MSSSLRRLLTEAVDRPARPRSAQFVKQMHGKASQRRQCGLLRDALPTETICPCEQLNPMQTAASSDWAGGTLPGVMAGKRPPRSAKLVFPVIFLVLCAQAATHCVAAKGKELSPGASGLPPRAIQAGTDKTGPGRITASLRTHKETSTTRRSGTGCLLVVRPAESMAGADLSAAVGSIDSGSAAPGADAVRSPEPQYTNTYYVSPAGNDTNPGTFDLPLRTIQAGVDRAYAGERVFVLAGTYKEQVTFPRSGTSGAPITISGEVDGAGNPLALIDNTEAVGATWSPAPDVGAGVYKRVGFAPKLMLWNGEHILGINAKHMAGDSDQYCDKGFNILNYPPDKVWHPGGSASCSTAFWDDVMVLYGTLGETTFVRFRDYDDPNGQDLRAAPANTVCLTLRGNSYITVEHLILQGAVTSVVFDGSDHNIFRHNVVRHGNQRMTLSGSSGNLIEHNYFSLGYGEYGCFGEWGAPYTGILARRYAAYALGKWLAGNGSSLDRGVVLSGKNEFANNTVRQGDIGIYGGSSCEIHDNIISEFSSVGFYIGPNVRDIRIHDNRIYHCNGGIRFGSIGASYDSVRSGYIYRNRCYNDSGVGQFIITHTAGSNFTKAPDFWFYHNSVAGGNAWGQALYGACGRMKVVNNVMSSVNLMTGAAAIDDTTPTVWAAFDYNFMGGKYRGYRYFNWAATDSHNLWAADTMKGDVNHQVWSLGTEPDWIVPETSAAFCSGLDLSDSFTIRGVTYGPLPGMAKGYFTGSAPNLGAGQNTYQVEIPQGDPGPGGDTRPLELAFVPNPVTGRGVTVQCALPAGKVGELTMRDVVGRCVKSFALDPSGQTRLDLRGFAPGIYVAVLDAAGPSISRKLIVARRD